MPPSLRRLLTPLPRTGRLALWVAVLLLPAMPSAGQETLTLDDAIRRAREAHPSARAAQAAVREAGHTLAGASGAWYPVVDVSQSWQRGNHPVFVFGSLLAQRRFSAGNFSIPALNHPDAVGNLRSAVSVTQRLFDGGQASLGVKDAALGRDAAEAQARRVTQAAAFAAAQAFTRVAHLSTLEDAHRRAVEAAEADAVRARARRDAGVVTDADVLASAVHLSRARAALIDTTGSLAVARASLNDAMGVPLDARFDVVLVEPAPRAEDLAVLERQALSERPEAREAGVGRALAATALDRARSAYAPQVGLQGGWELNGATPAGVASSWVMGVEVRWNLFRGFADRARVAGAREAETRREAEREGVDRAIRLEVRTAMARLESARAKVEVGRAALDEARESQRILRDRYEYGRATMTDVLDAARAVAQAEADAIAARVEVVMNTVALDRAVGRL